MKNGQNDVKGLRTVLRWRFILTGCGCPRMQEPFFGCEMCRAFSGRLRFSFGTSAHPTPPQTRCLSNHKPRPQPRAVFRPITVPPLLLPCAVLCGRCANNAWLPVALPTRLTTTATYLQQRPPTRQLEWMAWTHESSQDDAAPVGVLLANARDTQLLPV